MPARIASTRSSGVSGPGITGSGRIDGGNDDDFASFVVPANANAIALTHSEKGGDVTYRYFLNGAPIVGEDPVLPPIAGATYTVRITATNGGKHPTYELGVSFN